MPRGGAADTTNLGFLLAKASQRWNERLGEAFRQHDFAEVRPSYGSVLLPLFEQDGLRIGAIARRARLSKQTMTTLVRLCERDGLVTRARDTGDGRAFRIELTPRGRAFQAVAATVLEELDQHVLTELGTDQHDALITALQGVME